MKRQKTEESNIKDDAFLGIIVQGLLVDTMDYGLAGIIITLILGFASILLAIQSMYSSLHKEIQDVQSNLNKEIQELRRRMEYFTGLVEGTEKTPKTQPRERIKTS